MASPSVASSQDEIVAGGSSEAVRHERESAVGSCSEDTIPLFQSMRVRQFELEVGLINTPLKRIEKPLERHEAKRKACVISRRDGLLNLKPENGIDDPLNPEVSARY